MSDWPQGLPIKVRRIPIQWLRIQLLINLTFFLLTGILHLLFHRQSLTYTIGAAAPFATVRIIQFLHSSNNTYLTRKLIPYPGQNTMLRRVYQRIYAWWEQTIERIVIPNSQRVIAISKRVASDLSGLFGTLEIDVIHHGVPEPVSNSADGDVTRILFVGALERKGMQKCLDVLALLKDQAWEFTAIGGGDIEKYRQHSAAIGIDKKVTFTGPQRAEEFFARNHVFLFPSYYEPFGLVVAEAAAAGCLPVSSIECGASELWQSDGATTTMSAEDSNETWANCLGRLLSNPEERDTKAMEAQDIFCKWSWDRVTDAYEDTFNKVVNRP